MQDVLQRSPSAAADPEREAVRDFWNRNVHEWKVARHEPGSREWFREIEEYRFEKLHYLPRIVDFAGYAGRSVLDVGCGVGNDLARFAAGGARVTGVDLAERSVELARRNFRQRGLDGTFLLMDGERLALRDDSFDCVYCHTTLQFTPRPEAMVREIHRVLRPGGTAILMGVNRRSWLYALQGVMKVEIDHLGAPVYHRFTSGEMRSMCAPFRDVRIVPERFPVPTKVHGGLKARVYNLCFVRLFHLFPRAWTRWSGHHLVAFATKG